MANPIEVAKNGVEKFNAGDWSGLRSTLTSDTVEDEFATQRRLEGPEAMAAAAEGWKRAFPDAHGTVRNAMASGNTAILEITWQGTQTGDLVGPQGTIPASGRQVSLPAIWVAEVEGDKTKAVRHYFDLMTLLAQIGAVPAGTS